MVSDRQTLIKFITDTYPISDYAAKLIADNFERKPLPNFFFIQVISILKLSLKFPHFLSESRICSDYADGTDFLMAYIQYV